MSDLIERVVNIICANDCGAPEPCSVWCKEVSEIMELKPAQPEQRWIPCSERLPEESGRYIITAYDGVSRRTATAVFQKRLGGWCLSGRMAYWRVVAWMSLPEPYQEESES